VTSIIPDQPAEVTLRLQVLVRPDSPAPVYTRWHKSRLEVVVRPDVATAELGALLADAIAVYVAPVDCIAHVYETSNARRELVVSHDDHAHLRTLLDDDTDPADELARRWGYEVVSGFRESGRPGYSIAPVRHIRGAS
jgi:hypothetical protein